MNQFRYYRAKKGLSQKDVGQFLGITGQAYSNYEAGKRQADYETLLKLSELYETSIENLLSQNPPEKKNEVEFDDFTYSMYKEAQGLTEEDKQQLLRMARFFREQQDQKEK